MNFLPLISAFLQAGSFTLDKIILNTKQVTYKIYDGASFLIMFLINVVLFLLFRPDFSLSSLTPFTLLLIGASSAIFIGNVFFLYRALDLDKLGEIDIIVLFRSVAVILLSTLFFADERNPTAVVLGIVAMLALVWSHWEHHHFKLNHRTLWLLVWMISIAPLSDLMTKVLLETIHPLPLEIMRTGIMALVLGPIYYQYEKHVRTRVFFLLILTNILTTIAAFLYFLSYQRVGIVQTVLIFSLQPLLVYGASIAFLKEKFKWKKAVAFAIVLGAIILAQII